MESGSPSAQMSPRVWPPPPAAILCWAKSSTGKKQKKCSPRLDQAAPSPAPPPGVWHPEPLWEDGGRYTPAHAPQHLFQTPALSHACFSPSGLVSWATRSLSEAAPGRERGFCQAFYSSVVVAFWLCSSASEKVWRSGLVLKSKAAKHH